jgi:dolichol-phosphate mannosyltransferase
VIYSTRVFAKADAGGPDLSIVVPTYNERDGLAALVEALFSVCAAHDIDLELVIVDDNSPDGTGAVADGLAKTRRIRVLHRAGKLGLGTAVMAGFELASAPILGVMDADFSHPPALVPSLLATMNRTGADIVVASRYIRGGSTPSWPFRRRMLSRIACLLARPLSPIRDAASGFFLIHREVIRGLSIKAGGFKICLEIVVRAWPHRLVEVPYQFDDRELGESKMSMREALGYLVQLRDLFWLRLKAPARPKRVYQRLSAARVQAMLGAAGALPPR